MRNADARICVPICARRADELPAALARAAAEGDLVEVRFDCLEASQLEAALRALGSTPSPRPLLYTFRPEEEGGRRALDAGERRAFWEGVNRAVRAGELRAPDFIDLELDLFKETDDALVGRLGEHSALVCSRHDFHGTPADLESIYERMSTTPAFVLKLAVRAERITDCVAVLKLLDRARRGPRRLVAVSMGEAGLLTRVLGPARGSFLTFGALEASEATAPGQVTARELRELYRVHQLTERTAVTGLVGSPVSHSLSPHMHNAAFAAKGFDGVYLPFEVADAPAFLRRMVAPRTRELDWPLRGLSVTAPHKSAVIESLDRVESRAREIGAVNTVVVEGDELRGYNTDAEAALAPLRGLVRLEGARVAVLGAGGAARALLWGLRESGAHATVFGRDERKARALAGEFGAQAAALAGASFQSYELVVNATPLGTRGKHERETAADADQLRGARLAYDLVYNPQETRFLREARAAGCATLGGLPMLIAQAAEQFRLWTGLDAPTDVMRAAAEKQMSTKQM